jgi:hypothetical protein
LLEGEQGVCFGPVLCIFLHMTVFRSGLRTARPVDLSIGGDGVGRAGTTCRIGEQSGNGKTEMTRVLPSAVATKAL